MHQKRGFLVQDRVCQPVTDFDQSIFSYQLGLRTLSVEEFVKKVSQQFKLFFGVTIAAICPAVHPCPDHMADPMNYWTVVNARIDMLLPCFLNQVKATPKTPCIIDEEKVCLIDSIKLHTITVGDEYPDYLEVCLSQKFWKAGKEDPSVECCRLVWHENLNDYEGLSPIVPTNHNKKRSALVVSLACG